MTDPVLRAGPHPRSTRLHLALEDLGVGPSSLCPEERCAAVLDAWLARPGEELHELVVSTITEHSADLGPVEAVLAARRPGLYILSLGALTFPDHARGSYVPEDLSRDGGSWCVTLHALDRLLVALPRLTELVVQANQIDYHDPASSPCAPALRRLALRADSLSPAFVAALARSRFPVLGTLELWLGDYDYGWGGTADELEPLFAAVSAFPALRHLKLVGDVGDPLIARLADAPLLPGLQTLDLSHGTLGEAGASLLCERWPRFAHLDRLVLTNNLIDPASASRLRELGPRPPQLGCQRWCEHPPRCAPPALSIFVGPG